MADQQDTDVLVVGASPSGLVAAREAAKAGATVTLLEAGRIGHPEPPAVVGFDHVWPADIKPPDHAIRTRFRRVHLTSPGGHRLTVRAPGRIADRGRLDAWLADQAREAGAQLRIQTGPWEVDGPGRLVQDDEAVTADVVVFADGARSIARSLLDPVRAPERLVWGVTHEVDVASPRETIPIGVGSHAPGGRTQLVPVGRDRTWHWTFVRRPREDAIRLAQQALEETARRRGWDPATVEEAQRLHVAPDPVFQKPAELVGPRTIVTGGAGGLGGLESGLAAGGMAGRAAARALADPARALRAYQDACHERFAPAYEGLAQLSRASEHVPDRTIDALFEPWTDRVLDLNDLAGLAWTGPLERTRTVLGLARASPSRLTSSLARALVATVSRREPTRTETKTTKAPDRTLP